MVADDLGWGDLGCYGNQWIKTPNIDALAAGGCRFTQYYVASPKCSPSRASMLTGKFPARLGIHEVMSADPVQNAATGTIHWLPPGIPTLSRFMQGGGYVTGCFGKWHLGSVQRSPAPTRYGFDTAKTFASRPLDWSATTTPDFYSQIDSLIADAALDFIHGAATSGLPWFAMVNFYQPHAPLIPSEAQLQPYAHFQSARVPYPNAYMIYGAAVTELDRQVGRLLTVLPPNTIVIFTSDNGPQYGVPAEPSPLMGAHHLVGSPGPFRGGKATLYEGGIRVPFIVAAPNVTQAATTNSSVLCSIDVLPTIMSLTGISMGTYKPDGLDMSAAIHGSVVERTKPLYWEFRVKQTSRWNDRSPMAAIRRGNFKLLANSDGSRSELFDMSTTKGMREVNESTSSGTRASLLQALQTWQATLPAAPSIRKQAAINIRCHSNRH